MHVLQQGRFTVHTYMYCRVINHCARLRRITHLGDLDISFVLLIISSKFLLHLECYDHPKGTSK